MKWFCQTTLLTPCHIFHNCEHLSAGKHNHVQMCTASHNNNPHFYFFILFCYFLIFLNFWEQVWAKLGSFWHTDQQCNTLINCEQNDSGKAKAYSQRVTTTKWRHFFCFFTFIMTCSEQMTTVKWQKSEKKWHFEQNWAKLSRICQSPNTYFSILSNFKQNWAGFTGPINIFF